MEILVDLDENVNFITRATLIQDFRDVYSKCSLTFTFPSDLEFAPGYGFFLLGTKWEVLSYKKILVSGSDAVYSVFAYPAGISSIVDTKQSTLSALARCLDIPFDSNVSTDFKFEFPLRNLPLGAMLYKYRYSSIEENVSNLGDAWFLYYDSRGLVGKTYASIASSELVSYDVGLSRFMGGSESFIRDYQNVNYCRDQYPARMGYKNLISSFVGDKFDFKGNLPGIIGSRYKLEGGGEEEDFSSYDRLVLVRQKYDSIKIPMPWTLTFGQLLAR